MAEVPPQLVKIATRAEVRVLDFLEIEHERWAALEPALALPFESLRVLVSSGGKRLRPAFCHWGFVGAGGDPDDQQVIDAGAAFELLHAFALVHDDVMDGSATRRGERTAHLTFADRHDDGQWIGEARRFGEGVAILVGDLAFVYADVLLGNVSPTAMAIWHELRVELNVGQYLDIVGTARRERNRSGAERIARYKSGKYTVERPLHLGAALAAPERVDELCPALSSYGLPLGDAFQLRDDVLGVFGDADVVGKPVGDDLREGKPTPLLAIATARASMNESVLLDRIGAPDLTTDEIAALQAIIVSTGALAEIEGEIKRLTDDAVASIESAPIAVEAREALVELAHYVAWRDK